VVLDWRMPGLEGLEVCRRIRAVHPRRETFVLVVAARHRNEALALMLDTGASVYPSKRATPERLQARPVIAERRVAQATAQREAAAKRARPPAGRDRRDRAESALAIQHEIDDPLAPILGNAALLEAGLCERAERDECVAIIVEHARRIDGVVKHVADLRGPQTVE